MMNIRLHKKRIVKELKEAGMTPWGFLKMETKRLPEIIHEDEKIGGVVYGRTTGDKIGSAMLIATDKRVIFLDVKPFFVTSDEIAYRVVSGVKTNNAGTFAGITLHTKVRDFSLRFVNLNCAKIFENFIETYIELHTKDGSDIYNDVNDVTSDKIQQQSAPAPIKPPAPPPTPRLSEFLRLVTNQNSAVISTVDKYGNAHGAVVHYVFEDGNFFIVTKAQTNKSKNITAHPQVALTIHAISSLKTAQILGNAEQEYDTNIKDRVYGSISEPKQYAEGNHLPPITSLKKGDVVVYRITPTDIQYQDFSKNSW
ncbi:pyridoxamine 5'-phosphate oxidase family protein [Candidatus Saccharibacteria bacterium]|nr:pyridoxamine 5'-phosphate oxidase family protein [Candidatus Saccharibacteria bacterium]